ncbi:MAG: hypothetical protein KC646_07365 [Candidatus Cloacimonetes bacterium]|nr:hypothetical protein [Candidatus Cloacimonadota bacterium]
MNIKTLLILSSLLLCGCDKSQQVSQEDSTPEAPISSDIDTTPVSLTVTETPSTSSSSDVIADAGQFLNDHDSGQTDSQSNDAVDTTVPSVSDTDGAQSQCGENGELFEGIETTGDCSDDSNDIPRAVPVSPQDISLCYFNKNTIRGAKLKTSKWAALGHLQRALKIKIDGVFGAGTRAALSERLNVSPLECISNEQYKKVTKKNPDSLRQRAANFSFMMEGTDYDDLEFNYGYDHKDPSGATWGPTGMTLRSGEISDIFKIALNSDEFTKVLSTQELSLVKQLSTMSGSQAKSTVKRLVWDKGSAARKKMKDLFKRIAPIKAVRDAFDKVSDQSIQDKLKYYEAFLNKHDKVSELDWAMFYDISIQTGKPLTKSKALMAQAPPNSISDPTKRREKWAIIISKQVSSVWEQDRLKRSMLFVGKDSLARAYGLGDRAPKFD